MTEKYTLKQDLMNRIARLADYFERNTRAESGSDRYGQLAAMTADLANEVEAGDYGKAGRSAFTIRRLSTEWLRWESEWLGHTDRIEHLVRALAGNYRCPYCNGHLRTAKAKQCPECLRDWHDPDNVRRLGPK
ncbi:MAG: hypothetical protein QNJ00_18490 [Woeseiaceae bacterium]|nr:hypothetical protein [Woeseiaceae bacterium]